MANPLNDARREQLQADAQELLEAFSKEYAKMFGVALLQKIQAEVEGGGDDPRKLKYRDWNDVQRPEVFTGECYVKFGGGPGAFGKWKKCFFAERQDYNFDYYGSEKEYQKGKKPKGTIHLAGYNVERDPSWHYQQEERSLVGAMDQTTDCPSAVNYQQMIINFPINFKNTGLSLEDLVTSFSPYAWALTHPVRENYVFQLHKGKNPILPCFPANTVEPDGLGIEFEGERGNWIEVTTRCAANVTPRDTTAVKGAAFEMACEKMKDKFERLQHWSDDGTESQILVSMLMEQCLTPMRDDMLRDLQGPTFLRLASWYKTRDVIQSTLNKMVDPAWAQMQKAADQLQEKIEPTIRQKLEPIIKLKMEAKDKIRGAITDKVSELLGKYVSPFLDPVFKALNQPLTRGFESSKDTYNSKVTEQISAGLPSDIGQVKLALDAIPRTSSNINDMDHAASELVQPLSELKSVNSEIFDGIDASVHKEHACKLLLETLDAAIFTLESNLEDHGTDFGSYAEEEKSKIVADFEHDIVIQRATFTKNVVRDLLIPNFKRALQPVTSPIIDGFNDVIPEDMQDFVNIENLYDEVIDLFVGEPIDKMVDAAA